MSKNRRIIFKSNDAVNIIRQLSVKYFWNLERLVRADPENQIPYELYFKEDGGDTEIVYVEDPISECSYVIISGSKIDEICSVIEEKTEFWTCEEMFADWDNAQNDSAQIQSILRIGVGAPYEYDEQFACKLEEGLADGDRAVREAALAAIGYRDWQEFDPILGEIAKNDPDERCRNRAAIMLEIRERERSEE
jgi:hypothetical protein